MKKTILKNFNSKYFSVYIDRKIKDYHSEGLKIEKMELDPILEFKYWYDKEDKLNKYEANKMVLGTVFNNKPRTRIVLMKKFVNHITFFTNYKSHKGIEIENNNNVSLLFHWNEINIQVRIEGKALKCNREENINYFSSRDKRSRFSSILSDQSKKMTEEDFLDFQNKIENLKEGEDLTCPENWGGYDVEPNYFEFWAGKESRAHERVVYELIKNKWGRYRLFP
jgi:pyridoxamine 5'-phosphate oxidase